MIVSPKIFKDYDIRAEIGTELDEEGVRRIAQAFISLTQPRCVGIGHDMRITGKQFAQAMIEEITAMGVDVIDLGLISTDASYFAANKLDVDYVVMITASHNPPRFNGFKFTKRGGVSLDGEALIYPIRDKVLSDETFSSTQKPGKISTAPALITDFTNHALSLIEIKNIKPLRVLIDAGNGMAGKILPPVLEKLPIQANKLFFELDGNFPNHLANPLIEAGQKIAREKLQAGEYDLGVLFDGDGDRMFLMTENGEFISGTITTAMVAKQILTKNPGEMVLYNAICGRIVPETINNTGGKSRRTRVGHSIIKKVMRETGAVFAGEHSGHYFFRDFFGADSGLVAMLFVLEYLSTQNKPVSEIVQEFDRYPQSGEINFETEKKDKIIKLIEEKYQPEAESVDYLDGISIWFPDWWVNVRPSNTQGVLRLNVEANSRQLLETKTQELTQLITGLGAKQSFE